jgi:hypothetical protein
VEALARPELRIFIVSKTPAFKLPVPAASLTASP